jgi:hypothetical protein
MDLSAREAATLLGRNPRTVRGQLARGELPGIKQDGRWVLRREDLPLTDSQRRALQAKAGRVRRAVENALPSRMARRQGDRSRSLADLDAFRLGAELLAEVRAHGNAVDGGRRAQVAEMLESGLLAVAEAAYQYDRDLKLAALNRARGDLSRAGAALLLEAGVLPGEPVASWVAALEREVLPAVAGFARWADGLGRARR